ncbi:putative hydrophobic protein (TIGR00271 family) [Sphingobacterium alimentarium]|uniref:Putative hydrophobic protein (TIGR00271 family) n=1 Tax=Sphingobacterium alimentarium TaxID=797292 RepID=A0A4R3W192_9SPHI|nr:DUF389 domain-containing protein [Sphingobacterium alimentarium]TCV19904.1 putative hydrophobic protein (TIGR00271 family) [Sphingobacterium alimentarium]
MLRSIYKFFNLHDGEDAKDKVLDNVTANITFKGANLWILACAIVIASVGLNVNSTAVIIGAMLISPLMGPIVGAGFALGTYDFDLLKKSGKNLLTATLVSLFVSFLYFLISPFKDAQSELLARTSPNIYDVIIAFFGGLVGVIAITRVEKGNPIPGVAIATALMPPLCTAGYGLAIGNISYFGGAIYLYLINCFFICISTFFIVKFLKYPKIKFVDKARESRITKTISVLIVVMLVPSFYLAYVLLEEKKFTQNIDKFIQNELVYKGYTLIYQKTQFNSRPKKLELAFLDKRFSVGELQELNQKMELYDIHNTDLLIRQDSSDLRKDILEEISKQNEYVNQKDITIQNLKNELKSFKLDEDKLLEELNILYPNLAPFSLGKQNVYINKDSSEYQYYLIHRNTLSAEEVESLNKWLSYKLPNNAINIVPLK